MPCGSYCFQKVNAFVQNPDDPSAGEKFQEMAAAYEILSVQETRDMYDEYGMDGLSKGGGRRSGATADDMFADMFSEMFGFGFGSGGYTRRRTRGRDTTIPYEVTLEDLYNGKSVKMNMEKEAVCGQCKG